MLYTIMFHGCKYNDFQVKICDIFIISEAVLTSTHNLCFRAKIRKNEYPCTLQFYYVKVGCDGEYITRTC